MKTCDPDRLEALVYGELPPADAAAAEQHTATCADCAGELAWLRAERAAMTARAEREPPLPPRLWRAIEERVAKQATVRRPLWLSWRWPAVAVAAGAVAAAVVAHLALSTGPSDPRLVLGAGDASAVGPAGVEALDAAPDGPADAPDRWAEAESAVAEAEAAHLAAIAAVETAYAERRASLAPDATAAFDRELRSLHTAVDDARAAAGDDVRSRMRLLGAYARQRRVLQAMLTTLEESP
jgi:hypothetical protein